MTHKKSIILAFFAATLAATTTYTFSACDDDNETTGQLKFAQQRLDMTVGEAKENIVYEGVPPYAAWSSDSAVAVAAGEGMVVKVRAKKPGTALITVGDAALHGGSFVVSVK